MSQADVQERLQRLQALSGQLQSIAQQRAQMEAMKQEAEQALSALEDLEDDATVYRSVGGLLVKDKSKAVAQERLQDDVETLGLRVKRMKTQEDEMAKQAESLQTELRKALGQ